MRVMLCGEIFSGVNLSHATRVFIRTAWDRIETRPKIYRGSFPPFLATRTLQDKQPDRIVPTVRLF